MRYLYPLLAYLLAPVLAIAMLWRGQRDRLWWSDFAERFGYGPTLQGEPPIWVHAVSVGEVQASAALVRALRTRYPQLPLVVTTVTPTGAQRARALFGTEASVFYLPFDLPGAVRRFLDRVRPRLLVILETELWPTLYGACRRRGVPLVLASARLSERSVRRYQRLGSLLRETLRAVVAVGAQSAADAERFRAIGADPARVQVTGNVKFDFAEPAPFLERGAALRRELAPQRPLWVAGSTHAGEEEVLIAAHRQVRSRLEGALLALAPRHPPRFAEVAAALQRAGVRFVSRSSREPCAADTEVLLIDTLGELVAFYAACDVAFVGGSLVSVGGHNLLEPAAVGRAVLTGPWNFNGQEIADRLVQGGGARVVSDAAALADAVVSLLGDAAQREHMGALASATLEANRGATERLMQIITPLLRAASPGSSGPASR